MLQRVLLPATTVHILVEEMAKYLPNMNKNSFIND